MPANHAFALAAPPPPPPGLQLVADEALEESRRAIAELVRLLGYPEEWAEHLARRELDRGRIWRKVR